MLVGMEKLPHLPVNRFEVQRFNTYEWVYDGNDFVIDLQLNYSTYSYFKNLDHSVDYNDISTYARFATPSMLLKLPINWRI